MFAIAHLLIIFLVLTLMNEALRRSKILSYVLFGLIPLVMTLLVWPRTTGPETSVNTWFHWVKLYSVLLACIGFTLMRFTQAGQKPWLRWFPPVILAMNILEAVIRDVELFSVQGGGWHILNALAGLFSILAISGWFGIHAEKKDKKDLLWPDMTPFWIIAYDVWNLVYIWYCVPEHAFYGIAVLAACTVPSLFIKKGTWIQARAFTLGMWMMYIMTFNTFADTPGVFKMLPSEPWILWAAGILSITLNGILVVIHLYRMIKRNNFKIGRELYAA